jgi:hypothetical protein
MVLFLQEANVKNVRQQNAPDIATISLLILSILYKAIFGRGAE